MGEIMEGVTVLSVDSTASGISEILLLLFVSGVIAIMAGFVLSSVMECYQSVIAGVVFGLGAFIMLMALCGAPHPDEITTTYKVTIDSSVSIEEFTKRYEIVDQDGMIYEIRERGNQ